MPPKKSKAIVLKVDHMISDRTAYKPYIVQLSNENLYVEVEIDSSLVAFEDSNKLCLTVDGMSAVLGKVADSIEAMHENYTQKQRKKFNS